jgi:mono/diheme cytochrome c family protein
MSRTGRWSTQATVGLILLVLGVVTAVVLLALWIPAGAPLHPGGSSLPSGQVSGTGLGERIFLTGTDENGNSIPRSGFTGMMGSVVACASCHGSDARGRTIQVMMSQVEVPDIRWSTLTATPADPADKAFDPDSFFLAVTQGLDPNGTSLKAPMPRWHLTRTESDAVVEYLKTR